MRIAFVAGRFPVLSEVFILQQVTGLLELGADVEIFANRPPPGEPIHDLYRDYGLASRTHYPSEAPAGRLRRWVDLGRRAANVDRARWPALARTLFQSTSTRAGIPFLSMSRAVELLRRDRYDIVHAHFGDSGRICAALPKSEARLVTTFHGYDANVAPRLAGPHIYRDLFSRGDAFTVNSQFLRRRLVSLGCPDNRITILPMGVDLDKFACTPRRRRPGEPVDLLTVGRLVPAKGIAYAIRAVAELLARGVALRYRIVGDGEERVPLEALIRELGVGDRVTLEGPKPHEEVRALYHEAHVFVLPSVRTPRGDEETQGLVVQEAQAAGAPVIVTDIGGVAEGILPGESGLSCRAADTASLSGAIERILARSDDWPAMGLAGRRLVEQKYSLPSLNRALLDLYQSLKRADA